MVTETTLKLIAQSKFANYTMGRLDDRWELLTSIIVNPDADTQEIADAANDRKEVEACIQLFIECEVDNPQATAAWIIGEQLNLDIYKLQKNTGGGLLAQDLLNKMSTAKVGTVNATKKSASALGSFLKTWGEK